MARLKRYVGSQLAALRRGAYGYDAPYALVTGVDIWSTHDQSGNAGDVTVRNASLEGVGDRVDIETGDMRALPFRTRPSI